MSSRPSDAGMVTAFVIVWATALLFVCGLVLDGGRVLAEKRQARNIAESAARAGAQAISEPALRANEAVVLDPDGARAAACAFLDRAGYRCGGDAQVTPAGNDIEVRITESVRMLLLPVGAQTYTVEGSACVAVGVTGAEPSARC